MQPREFHAFAKEIVKTTTAFRNDPATVRSAISRAYYGLFLSSREFLREIDFPTSASKGSDHWHVASTLQTIKDKELMSVGDALARYRQKRNAADYAINAVAVERVRRGGYRHCGHRKVS